MALTQNWFRMFLLGLSSLLVAYIYFRTSTLPFIDEIDDFLAFVLKADLNSLADIIDAYWSGFRSVHNGFLGQFLYFIQYRLFHILDFRLLPVIGNFFYCIGLYLLLSSIFSLTKRHYLLILPSILLFLPVNMAHNWGMVASGSILRLFFLVIGAKALMKNGLKWDFVFALSILLSISTGTGILVLFSFGTILVINLRKIPKQKIFILFLGVLASIAIYTAKTPENAPPPFEISNIVKMFKYLFASYGSVFQYVVSFKHRELCILYGIILILILLILIYILRAKILQKPILISVLVLMLIVPLAGASQRWQYGFHYAFSERFQIYSLFLFVLAVILFDILVTETRYGILSIFSQAIIAIVLIASANFNFKAIPNLKMHLDSGYVKLLADSSARTIFWDDHNGERWRTLFSEAIARDIFVPDNLQGSIEPYEDSFSIYKKWAVAEQGFQLSVDLHNLYVFAELKIPKPEIDKYFLILESKTSEEVLKLELEYYPKGMHDYTSPLSMVYGVFQLTDLPLDLENYKMHILGIIKDGIDFREDLFYKFIGPKLVK